MDLVDHQFLSPAVPLLTPHMILAESSLLKRKEEREEKKMEKLKTLDLSKLEKGLKIVTGVRNFKSKEKPVQTIFFVEPYREYDLDNSDACYGVSAGSVYSSTRYDLQPGDLVRFDYEPGYEGRAMLVDVYKITN